MYTHDPARPSAADQNVERLLRHAYAPERPDPEFARRVTSRMLTTARQRSQPRRGWFDRPRFAWGLAAALFVGLTFGVLSAMHPPRRPTGPAPVAGTVPAPNPAPVVVASHLTPRPKPAAPDPDRLAVGKSVRTEAGQRKRVALPDGSVLFLNEKTDATLTAERRVRLDAGEVYVEVAPRDDDPFTVTTPQRKVAALGTRFGVQAEKAGTGVVVTQGRVKVSGVDELIRTGQQLPPGAKAVEVAPRATHLLAWMEDLVEADGTVLPPNPKAGGVLVVKDSFGREAHLSLRKYHVDVHIEDGFARTTIDQTYFNHEHRRLEGTFHFPLPPDASLSRLAMYVNGDLMEGGMAEREIARAIYEGIVRRMQDPALLEWVDGSTFKMRVFPLEPRQEKRIVLSYTQKLPGLYGQSAYRFPSGHSLEEVRDWSFHATIRHGAKLGWNCSSHDLKATTKDNDLLLDAAANRVKVDRDIVLELRDETASERDSVDAARFTSAVLDGSRYLMLGYRPKLPGEARKQRRDWVVLFESSADRDPVLARTQIEIVRGLLTNAEHTDTFTILTAGATPNLLTEKAQEASPANVESAIARLEQAHLVGALDLKQALLAAEPLLRAAEAPHLVHVGSGLPGIGEKGNDNLLKLIPNGTRYVGVGVGKHWNRALMKNAADRSGGYFTQINPDEKVSWRAFDLLATLNTPRLLDVKVTDKAGRVSFLTQQAALAQGEELSASACTGTEADKLPEILVITGTLDGKPFQRELTVKDVADKAGYIPRTWARLEIDRLLAADPNANKARIVELSKAMYVMTPFTSLLVLENEQMYRDHKVDRGRKDHWAMYPCPPKIPIVTEWTDPIPAAKDATAKATPEEVLGSVIVRVPPPVVTWTKREPILVTAELEMQLMVQSVQSESKGVDDQKDADRTTRISGDRLEDSGVRFVVPRTTRQLDSILPVPEDKPAPMAGPVGLGGGIGGPGSVTAGASTSPLERGGFAGARPFPQQPFRSMSGPAFGSGGGRGAGGMFGGGPGFPGGGFGGNGGVPGGGPGFTGGGGFDNRLDGWQHAMLPGLQTETAPGTTNGYAFFDVYRKDKAPQRSNQWYERGEVNKLKELADEVPFLRMAEDKAKKKAVKARVEDNRATRELWGQDRFADDFSRDQWDRETQAEGLLRQRVKQFALSGDGRGYLAAGKDGTVSLWETQAARLTVGGTTGDALDSWLLRLGTGTGRPVAVYQRPAFRLDGRIGTDLLAHAPGLNSTSADVLAALESEVGPVRPAPGHIDPEADRRLRKSRAVWRTADIDGVRITFDGYGYFAWERTLPLGLHEVVVCDGKTLLHLYPELGLGGRRPVTAFHRAEFSALIPWVLPPADDLARGADVKAVGDDTVAVVPTSKNATHHLHLVFEANGRLAERRSIEAKTGKVVGRETYSPAGVVKLFDASGKELTSRDLAVRPGKAPPLEADTKDLVLIDLPLRSRQHVLKTHGANDQTVHTLKAEVLVHLLAADAAAGNAAGATHDVALLTQRSDFRPGLWTLLLSSGADPNGVGMPAPVLRSKVGRYVHWLQPTPRREWSKLLDLEDGLLRNLAMFVALTQDWSADTAAVNGSEVLRLTQFVREAKSPMLAWSVLDAVLRANKRVVTLPGGLPGLKRRLLDEALVSLGKAPALADAIHHEQAVLAFEAGDPSAKQRFAELFTKSAESGRLPAVDATMRKALGDSDAEWAARTRRTLDRLLSGKDYADATALAWQCWDLNDRDLADEVMAAVQAKKPAGEAALPFILAALEYYRYTSRLDRADALLGELLARPGFAERPLAWRLAAKLASERKQPVRTAESLDRALALEQRPGAIVDAQQVRQDYTFLLGAYEQQARAWATLQQPPPKDFADRVVRAADRWRLLDDDTAACHIASRILRSVGRPELAWAYLSTTLSGPSAEPAAVLELARSLAREGDREVAELAYRAASDAGMNGVTPERAANLEQSGRFDDARRLRERPR